MDTERYARARAIFFEALDIPSPERRAFVARECGEDDALRAEVDALLASLEVEEDALERGGPGEEARACLERVFEARDEGAPPGLPARIGRHEIRGFLGEGGMGVVYEAEQRQPRRRVAIKVLRPGLVGPDLVERFQREAELLGRLRHPGIASVFEAGRARPWGRTGPELPYLVMELVEGLPLTAHAAKAGLGVRERLELIARTCDAVQHAHERGVVHGDLKPANVLVDAAHQPRVLDFGVARALDADPRADGARDEAAVAGTLAYMSPEQLAPTGARATPSSDVHALGVLAFELLAGRLPLQLAGLPLAEAVRRVREVDPPRLGALDRRLKGDVEAMVARALEKDPARRYQSPAHFAADVRRHLAHEPILARPPRASYRAAKFVRRHRALAASVAGLVVVLAAGGATSAALAVRATRARRAAEAAVAEARRATYRAQLGAAVAALREGDARTVRAHLDAAPPELREWTWRHLDASTDDAWSALRSEVREHPRLAVRGGGTGGALEVVVAGDDGLAVASVDPATGGARLLAHRAGRFPAVSPDGARALEARDGRWLVHATRDLGARPAALEAGSGRSALALPDGSWAVQSGLDVLHVPADGSPPRPLGVALPEIDQPIGLEATPDGTRLAVSSTSGVTVVRLGAGVAPAARTVHGGRLATLAWDARGERLLVGDEHGRVHCASEPESPGACAWEQVEVGRQRVAFLGIAPDGRHFVAADRSGRTGVWSLDGGAPAGLAVSTGHGSTAAFFTPDSRHVLLPRVNGSLQQLALDGRETAEPRIGHEATVQHVAFAQGLALSVDRAGVVRAFPAPGAPDRERLAGHEAYAYAARFTRDGARVVSTGWDGTVRAWDTLTGAPAGVVRTGALAGRALAVLPGDRVVTVQDGSLLLLDPAAGLELARQPGDAVDVAADPGRIVAVQVDGGLDVWDASLSRRLARLPSTGGSAADARHACPAEGADVIVSNGATVRRLDAASGLEAWSAASMAGDVLALARHPDGTLVAGACRGGAVTLWDARTGATVGELVVVGGATLALAFDPSGDTLVTGSHDGSVQVWDVGRRERIARLPSHDDYVRDVAFSPDGSMLVSASGDTTLRLFDTLRLADRAARAGGASYQR